MKILQQVTKKLNGSFSVKLNHHQHKKMGTNEEVYVKIICHPASSWEYRGGSQSPKTIIARFNRKKVAGLKMRRKNG